MAKITQTEIVVRYLWARRPEWVATYELIKNKTEWGYLGTEADRRAFELVEVGYFDSATFRYLIQHKREGKYAHFRIVERIPIGEVPKERTFEEINAEAIKWFDELPDNRPTGSTHTGVGQSPNRFPKHEPKEPTK